MDTEVLNLKNEDFLEKIQDYATATKSEPDKLKTLEAFLEGLLDIEISEKNRSFQNSVIDQTLGQIDSLLGKHVMMRDCKVEDEDVIKVEIKNNVVVSFKDVD